MKRPLRRELMFQLVETSRLMRTYVDQRAREHGTTRAQWGVLSRLRRQEGLNQAALAEQMDLQPISLARLLDRLQSQDLIERRENPADRRAYLLYLTTGGRRLVDDLDDVRGAIAGELLGDVGDDAVLSALETLGMIRERVRSRRADDRNQQPLSADRMA
ncbi:MAG: MarR family transcriptional regulator [Bosea sp.]|uniref:MarR family winged helix-turn-helix transcriptional regulator n=1 Tax=unclassified Bosea (in: a-proteobacteria) TaxID=2653178 RepID=UPI000966C43F|nr:MULTISPECIES: MarR family transcriptional regulator [unclassified Bosea (in: a-proteobacteria)]MBN9456479.1 MarR family transcriptional regulator [Bosea sp. (in: a-proteobacteria)]OJV08730.1 MAG: MarR family transcriptional regulator [Bosea sp. 67-29]